MDIIIVSDLHLGEYSYGLIDSETGLNSRLLDVGGAFDEVIDYAIENEIGTIVIAGDIYHIKHPKSHIRKLFASYIKKALESGIRIIIIPGNHDQTYGLGRSHSLSEMKELSSLFDNLLIIEKPSIKKIDDEVSIAFLPFVNRADYRLASDEEFHNWQLKQIEKLSEKIDSKKKYFVGHFGTDKSVVGGSVDLGTSDNANVIPLSFLDNLNFDKIYLGDIHKHQILSEKTRHIGSIAQTTFGEENEKKGFYRLGKKENFININSTEFLTLYRDLRLNCREEMGEFIEEIQEMDLSKKIVRVKIDINEDDLYKVSFDGFKQYLKDNCYIFTDVYKNVIQNKKDDGEVIDELASVEEILKSYLTMSNTFSKDVYELGINVLKRAE